MADLNVDITNGQSNVIALTVPDTQRVTTVKEASQTLTVLDKYSIAGLSAVTDKHYAHNQPIAATVWVITHNLSKHPSITVVDSADTVVVGRVDYDSDNQVTLTFSGAFSGKAYLN